MKGKTILHKLLTMALALTLCLPLFGGVFGQKAEAAGAGTDYPTVFVHGLLGWGDEDAINKLVPYWGMTAGDLNKYMHNQGYSTYVASVGPVSSAWDRCCELYAQLAGTKVDYGQAHADKCCAEFDELDYDLHHDRYGRDYTGKALIEESWGPIYENGKVVGWNDTKVNLVGHSFGGPTICEFLQLLAEGDEAERAWGREQAALYGGDWHDYISPLFWGDYEGQYLVNSLTTLAGVLNGTTFISACHDETEFLTDFVMAIGNAIGCTDLVGLYDFQLEHFGLTKTPGTDAKAYFSYLLREGFIEGSDQAWYDLSIAGCNELKQGWETYDNVYYFSYAGDKTTKTLTGKNIPDADMWLLFQPFSTKMGAYVNRYEFIDNVDGTRWGYVNDEWLPNDGMVNSICARCPLGAANKAYDADSIEPGVWNVYPDQDIDHLGFSGGILNSKPLEIRKFYSNLMEDIGATVPVDMPAADPEPLVSEEPAPAPQTSEEPVVNPEPSEEPAPAPEKTNPFVDVAEDAVYYDAVLWAYYNEPQITKGVDETHFAPDDPCVRGQVVTFLWRAAGCPEAEGECPFEDVSPESAYYDAITWASEQGIARGYDETHFMPGKTVTRAEFVAFLHRFFAEAGAGGANPFEDVSDDSVFCADIAWAAAKGITQGYDATHFRPDETCTRWHVVTFMSRALG